MAVSTIAPLAEAYAVDVPLDENEEPLLLQKGPPGMSTSLDSSVKEQPADPEDDDDNAKDGGEESDEEDVVLEVHA